VSNKLGVEQRIKVLAKQGSYFRGFDIIQRFGVDWRFSIKPTISWSDFLWCWAGRQYFNGVDAIYPFIFKVKLSGLKERRREILLKTKQYLYKVRRDSLLELSRTPGLSY